MVQPLEQKVKKKYTIVVEGFAPVKVEFDTFAYDEEEAMRQLDNPALLNLRQRPEVDLARLQRKKATLKDAYTSLVKFIKNF